MFNPPIVEGVERELLEVATRRFGSLVRRRAELTEAIRALSDRYNDEHSPTGRTASRRRGRRGHPRAELDLLARLLFFTVADLPKVGHCLVELHRCGYLPAAPAWRVLDVGAGCGTQSLGLLACLSQLDQQTPPAIAIDAVDLDSEALALMNDLLVRIAATLPQIAAFGPMLRQRLSSLPVEPMGPYELILVGGLLAELPANKHGQLIDVLLSSLSEDGAMIIIEPALRKTARDLHRLRDMVIERKLATVFAPCTHCQPCPVLANATDWCHELRTWTPPPSLRQLAAASGLRRRDLKWAYLTLRTASGNVADPERDWARVVSSQLRSKGKREVFLCSDQGRHRITRLDRDASAANDGFEQLSRGCLAQLSPLRHRGQSLRVGPDTRLRWLDSFARDSD